ncbi:unnamed protein product [Pleuronectes platessa]|uniref:Uncharacterized protein n=1 Tax=Pleuronectes platessa TaxID=8262 RepID=A0A9N7YX30_PLEPL|nr:unnamed protein product [Pleuronectes platessa]
MQRGSDCSFPGHVQQELLIRGNTTYNSLTMPHRDGGEVCVYIHLHALWAQLDSTLVCVVGTARLCLCPTLSLRSARCSSDRLGLLLPCLRSDLSAHLPRNPPPSTSTSSSINVSLSSALTGS